MLSHQKACEMMSMLAESVRTDPTCIRPLLSHTSVGKVKVFDRGHARHAPVSETMLAENMFTEIPLQSVMAWFKTTYSTMNEHMCENVKRYAAEFGDYKEELAAYRNDSSLNKRHPLKPTRPRVLDVRPCSFQVRTLDSMFYQKLKHHYSTILTAAETSYASCLLYTSPSPRD
mgnify:CR=1 FL=1